MDRRTLIAMVVALTAWWVYLTVNPLPETPEGEEPGAPTAEAPVASATPSTSAAPVAAAPARDVALELCRSALTVTTANGAARSWRLLDVPGPIEVQSVWGWAMTGFSGPFRPYGDAEATRELLTRDADALVVGAGSVLDAAPPVEVVEQGAGRLVTRSVADGVEIVRTLTASGTPCRVELEVTWRNAGVAPYGKGVWVALQDVLHEAESQYEPAPRPKILVDGGLESLDDLEPIPAPELLEGQVGWIGLDDAFFGVYLVPADATTPARAGFTSRQGPTGLALGAHYVLPDPIAPGASVGARFLVYAGDKVVEHLEAASPVLGDAVELGWFAVIARPLLWLLKVIHGAVGNWGVAIIGLTLLVKLALFPLTQKSFKSSQEMQAIQPQLQALREQYAKDPEELNRQTLKLFQEHGVNPLGGCLPMLFQMPVFFALFSTLQSSVELAGADFLYLHDLSRPDPWFALPTIVTGLMLVQQQMMPTSGMDPAQARMMKVMPLIFGVFFFSFPAGLALYTFVNMVLSIVQQWYIKRTFRPARAVA